MTAGLLPSSSNSKDVPSGVRISRPSTTEGDVKLNRSSGDSLVLTVNRAERPIIEASRVVHLIVGGPDAAAVSPKTLPNSEGGSSSFLVPTIRPAICSNVKTPYFVLNEPDICGVSERKASANLDLN